MIFLGKKIFYLFLPEGLKVEVDQQQIHSLWNMIIYVHMREILIMVVSYLFLLQKST